MTTKRHAVFTYGSLLTGLGNHRVISDQQFCGEGEALGSFEMRALGGFPGAYEAEGGQPLIGELYEVDDDGLARLDRLESNGRFYQRVRVTVRLQGLTADREREAWVYLLMRPSEYQTAPLVSDNDWRGYAAGLSYC